MYDYREQLRRLAVHDGALVDVVMAGRSAFAESVLDARSAAIVRLAATVVVGAAPSSLQQAVRLALAAGTTMDEIVATLEAVAPVAGSARVVAAAPTLALALGYDVETALERLDP